jgi:hypothetical protein
LPRRPTSNPCGERKATPGEAIERLPRPGSFLADPAPPGRGQAMSAWERDPPHVPRTRNVAGLTPCPVTEIAGDDAGGGSETATEIGRLAVSLFAKKPSVSSLFRSHSERDRQTARGHVRLAVWRSCPGQLRAGPRRDECCLRFAKGVNCLRQAPRSARSRHEPLRVRVVPCRGGAAGGGGRRRLAPKFRNLVGRLLKLVA